MKMLPIPNTTIYLPSLIGSVAIVKEVILDPAIDLLEGHLFVRRAGDGHLYEVEVGVLRTMVPTHRLTHLQSYPIQRSVISFNDHNKSPQYFVKPTHTLQNECEHQQT